MQMPDMPVNVPVDDPNADTEWNDILRKHGVIPEKPPSPTPMIQEALEQARELAHENRLEGKDLDELAELEDEEDEDFLESYRKKRMAELSTISTASVYNQVYHLQKPDYSRDVTEASQKAHVLVLLTSSSETEETRQLNTMWAALARKFGDVKFCQMQANLCIKDYPDRHTPTIMVYKDGDLRRTIVTLKELNGLRNGMEDLERLLLDVGAVKLGDVRLQRKKEDDADASTSKIRQGKTTGDDEDSDWE